MLLLNRKAGHVFIIVVLGLIGYANTLHVPFILDDFPSIAYFLPIKKFSYFIDFDSAKAFKNYGGFVSRYFGYLTFALNYRIHGLSVTGYHLVNITIHLMASLLVYRLITLTFQTPFFSDNLDHSPVKIRAEFIALFAALLFVAHPLQTQAVTYIVQRLASLAAMLYLLTLTCYIRARLAWNEPSNRTFAAGIWCAASLVSAVLAMKTKETVYTLPFVVALYELLFFTNNVKRKLFALGLAIVVLVGSVGTLSSISSGRSLKEIIYSLDTATRLQTSMSRWDYLATECRVLVTYLRLVFFPVDQQLDYDYPVYHTFLKPEVLLSCALLCALFAAAVYCLHLSRKGNKPHDGSSGLFRLIAFGIFWFFITLSVESSIIPIVDVIFEHRMYLPSAGLFIAVAAAISLAGGASSVIPGWPKVPMVIGAAGVVFLLTGLTVSRNHVWHDEISLWEDNARKSPKKSRIFIYLGVAKERSGDFDGALEAYRRAGVLDPVQTDSHINIGLLYVRFGQYDNALAEFRAALAREPDSAEAHNNIGQVYGMQSRYDEALKEFIQATKLKPTLAEPYANIGNVYALQKHYPEALKEYDKALARDPDYVLAYINRGISLQAAGRNSEALADFRRALKIDPSSIMAAEQLRRAVQIQ